MPNAENLIGKGFDSHPENIVAGRPKGAKNRSTILKKWIEVKVKIEDKDNPLGREMSGTVEDQIALALLYKAIAGDVQAIKEINDTLYGKIPDKNQLTGADGKDLNTNITIELIDSSDKVDHEDTGS